MSRRVGVNIWSGAGTQVVMPTFIEVLATPPGEAPADVRRAWVGLKLPLAVEGLQDLETMGVISGRRGRLALWLARRLGRFEMMQGYLVDARAAIDILATTQPEAAAWWRDNTPDLLKPGQRMVFPALVARRHRSPRPEPANQP